MHSKRRIIYIEKSFILPYICTFYGVAVLLMNYLFIYDYESLTKAFICLNFIIYHFPSFYCPTTFGIITKY